MNGIAQLAPLSGSSEVIPALPFLFLLATLLAAIASDLRTRRIPNSLILAGWAFALGWHLFAPQGDWTFDPVRPGAVGILGAIAGLVALLLAFMPFYALRIMGAGDVKLMSVVGAFFGASVDAWVQLVGVSLFVLAAGGMLALLRIVLSRNGAAVLANLRVIFAGYAARAARMPGPSFDARADSADRMPYAVAIATGTLLYLVTKWAGWITIL